MYLCELCLGSQGDSRLIVMNSMLLLSIYETTSAKKIFSLKTPGGAKVKVRENIFEGEEQV